MRREAKNLKVHLASSIHIEKCEIFRYEGTFVPCTYIDACNLPVISKLECDLDKGVWAHPIGLKGTLAEQFERVEDQIQITDQSVNTNIFV
jgi:hypothetical protein